MSLFNIISKKKNFKEPVDLSVLKVDVHSHILPGIDDGSPDIESSIKIIEGLKNFGFQKVIMTPHIMSDLYVNTPETIKNAYQELQNAIKDKNIDIEIDYAAEYLLDGGLLEHAKTHGLIPVSDNYVLIELPYFSKPPKIFEVIFEIESMGYKIILAHPERYIMWHNDFSKFEELKKRNVFFQLNIMTFADIYPYPTRKIAEKLIKNDMVEFLGTDVHNTLQYKIIKQALYDKHLYNLINSGKILNHTLVTS